MSILFILKLVHLGGMVAGLGGLLLMGFTILTGAVIQPVSREAVKRLHRLLFTANQGLGVLWLSGIALVWARFNEDPATLSDAMLWAKIAVVTALTFSGALVQRVLLPHLERRVGERLLSLDRIGHMAGLAVISAVWSASWVTPTALGYLAARGSHFEAGDVIWHHAWGMLAVWFGIMIVSVLKLETAAKAEADAQDAAILRVQTDALKRRASQVVDGAVRGTVA
jgi:hypothetical protein